MQPADETKECPFCAETIKKAAVLCRYCNSNLAPDGPTPAGPADAGQVPPPIRRTHTQVPRRAWPHLENSVPLLEWRGFARMTRAESVPAYCATCRSDWAVAARIANTIAEQLGLGGRLRRGGTSLERFGATFAPMSSGRRIAAGNEEERQVRELAVTLSGAACPWCRSVDAVRLAPPP
jgi:hypothetical protein